MKLISTALVGLMMTAVVPAITSRTAKADGGAILIGVGVYLAGDYVVGHTCQMRDLAIQCGAESILRPAR